MWLRIFIWTQEINELQNFELERQDLDLHYIKSMLILLYFILQLNRGLFSALDGRNILNLFLIDGSNIVQQHLKRALVYFMQ